MAFTATKIADGVATWLHVRVWPEYWDSIATRAASRMKNAPRSIARKYPGVLETITIDQLIDECRPAFHPENEFEAKEYLADWIVGALTFVCETPNEVRLRLRDGLKAARGRSYNGPISQPHYGPMRE